MKKQIKRKRSGIVIALILFLFSAAFLIYGIYMVRYSLGYVSTYTGTTTVSTDKVMQYVASASAIYFGFGILFAACGAIVLYFSSILFKTVGYAPAEHIVLNADTDMLTRKTIHIILSHPFRRRLFRKRLLRKRPFRRRLFRKRLLRRRLKQRNIISDLIWLRIHG